LWNWALFDKLTFLLIILLFANFFNIFLSLTKLAALARGLSIVPVMLTDVVDDT
jgi:hypothetical protein